MKHTNQKISFVSLLLFCSISLFSQEPTRREFIRAVQDADISFYYDENYEEAARQYESLLSMYPDNYNLSEKPGICYLNLD